MRMVSTTVFKNVVKRLYRMGVVDISRYIFPSFFNGLIFYTFKGGDFLVFLTYDISNVTVQLGEQAVDILFFQRLIRQDDDRLGGSRRFQPGKRCAFCFAVKPYQGFQKMFFHNGINFLVAIPQFVGFVEQGNDLRFLLFINPFQNKTDIIGFKCFHGIFDGRSIIGIAMGESRKRRKNQHQ